MAVERYFIILFVFAGLLSAQVEIPPQGAILEPAPAQQPKLEIPPPTKPELEPADFKLLSDALLKQQTAWLDYQRKRAESLEAEKRANETDKSVLDLLSKLKGRYQCQACDLSWQGKWSPMGTLKFSTPKPPQDLKTADTKPQAKPKSK